MGEEKKKGKKEEKKKDKKKNKEGKKEEKDEKKKQEKKKDKKKYGKMDCCSYMGLKMEECKAMKADPTPEYEECVVEMKKKKEEMGDKDGEGKDGEGKDKE